MVRRVSKKSASSAQEDKAVLPAIWTYLLIGWIVIVAALAFIAGGVSVALPFWTGLREWSKTITLYDLLSGPGYYYAVLMAAIGATLVFIFEGEKDKFYLGTLGISLLGTVILTLLVVGKLI